MKEILAGLPAEPHKRVTSYLDLLHLVSPSSGWSQGEARGRRLPVVAAENGCDHRGLYLGPAIHNLLVSEPEHAITECAQ